MASFLPPSLAAASLAFSFRIFSLRCWRRFSSILRSTIVLDLSSVSSLHKARSSKLATSIQPHVGAANHPGSPSYDLVPALESDQSPSEVAQVVALAF